MNYQGNRQREPGLNEIWSNYLQGGYFDTQGNFRVEYVKRERVEPLIQAMANAYPKLTSNQLRRFFGHCRAIEAELRAKTKTWEQKRADFYKLDIAAADGIGKTEAKIPRLFYDFIRLNVAAIKSEKDFLEGFMPHFEALVGFGSSHLERERRG